VLAGTQPLSRVPSRWWLGLGRRCRVGLTRYREVLVLESNRPVDRYHDDAVRRQAEIVACFVMASSIVAIAATVGAKVWLSPCRCASQPGSLYAIQTLPSVSW
jgi:hypothetical protein